MLDYIYSAQASQYAYYRIPKILFTDDRYRDISTDAKVLYGLLLDRVSLSIKNKWVDDQNRVFIIFSLADVQESLNCGPQKATALFRELEKKAGLIERKRQGLGKPNLIYGNTAQMLKYTLSESHLAKSNRITPYFCPQSALIQAARQGLSARIRFANANMILNLARCFSSPRYRVFRNCSCFLTTPNTCSTFARTEDFACSTFFAAYWPLLLSFFN